MTIDIVTKLTADPIGFLSSNVVTFRGGVTANAEEIADFYISPQNMNVRYRTGSKFMGLGNAKANGRFYTVSQLKPGWSLKAEEESFRAMWSGYVGKQAIHCELPANSQASIMLTPLLDGCTVTWSHRPDGSARFGHYNLKADAANGTGPTLGAAGMRTAAIQNYGQEAVGTLSKEYYYDKAKRVSEQANVAGKLASANAFGVKQGGKWSFYVQYMESKGTATQIRGVEKLRPARHYNLERY